MSGGEAEVGAKGGNTMVVTGGFGFGGDADIKPGGGGDGWDGDYDRSLVKWGGYCSKQQRSGPRVATQWW